MSVLYFSRNSNKICKWNKIEKLIVGEKKIRTGDALCIEYKRIRILSDKFDWIGNSEIAIVNNIRTIQTKEAAPDNIIYYDKSVNPTTCKNSKGFKIIDIDRFDPGEYGNSICYYTPSYQNNNISICTKFYEIDERFGVLHCASKLLNLGNPVPNYGIYFSLAGKFLDGVDKILDRLTFKNKLIDDHVIELNPNDTDRPIYYGKYICLPTVTYNDITDITNNYTLDDTDLVHVTDKTLYKGSYFILELSDIRDPNLYDFDFNQNANDLVNKLNNRDKIGMEEFIQSHSDSYNFKIIQELVSNNTSDPFSLYNKLSPKYKTWVDNAFPSITSILNKTP